MYSTYKHTKYLVVDSDQIARLWVNLERLVKTQGSFEVVRSF